MNVKIYEFGILDVKYQHAVEHLTFQYLTYEVLAED